MAAPTFDNFAGQLVASGIRTNGPVIAFENTADRTALNNLGLINGLIPKLGKVLIRETRVKDSPLDPYFKKRSLPFGVGWEDAEFTEGAINKKNDGTCIPYGTATATSQVNLINAAWSFSVGVYDKEINKAVMSEEEVGQYVAAKLRTMRKGYAQLKNRCEVQIISDVIDGTRSVSSTTQSDGNGTSVSYAPSITGYAGKVEKSGIVLPELVSGTVPAFASGAAAVSFVTKLENACAEMYEESTNYSKLGINTFLLDRPLCIMETKVLNALDNSWTIDGTDKKIPTRTAREFIGRFADIVEIPKFAALPTNASYSDQRLAACLIDRDSLSEMIAWENTESQRCATGRYTGFNLAGESAIGVYRGNPAFALLTDVSE